MSAAERPDERLIDPFEREQQDAAARASHSCRDQSPPRVAFGLAGKIVQLSVSGRKRPVGGPRPP